MKIQLLNHASIIVQFQDVKFLTDPITIKNEFSDGVAARRRGGLVVAQALTR
jgi:L-ascorbate metabolism protein UlaG (beta-lactamase superfamily)